MRSCAVTRLYVLLAVLVLTVAAVVVWLATGQEPVRLTDAVLLALGFLCRELLTPPQVNSQRPAAGPARPAAAATDASDPASAGDRRSGGG